MKFYLSYEEIYQSRQDYTPNPKIPPAPLYKRGKLLMDSRVRGNDNWVREWRFGAGKKEGHPYNYKILLVAHIISSHTYIQGEGSFLYRDCLKRGAKNSGWICQAAGPLPG